MARLGSIMMAMVFEEEKGYQSMVVMIMLYVFVP
jgi:hypothetical protein